MHTDIPVRENMIIAVLDNKISFKSQNEQYFWGKWYTDKKTANNVWETIKQEASELYDVEVINKEYPKIKRFRKELMINGVIK